MKGTPEQYLEDKLNKTPELAAQEQAKLFKKMREPFAHTVYKESDSTSLNVPAGSISLSYGALPKRFFNPHRLRRDEKSLALILLMRWKPEQFRELTVLEFKKDEKKLSIREMLPVESHIYFSAKSSEKFPQANTTRLADREEDSYVIDGEILNAESVLALLHEVGHANDDVGKKEQEKIRKREAQKRFRGAVTSNGVGKVIRPTAEDLAIILESERNAWAFALRKADAIKDFFDLSREDIKTYIHEVALASYAGEMRTEIEKGLV